jgi:hypothetical protein
MAVGVESDSYRGMTKHLGDDLGVDVAGEEQRCAGVPEVVEAGSGGEAGTLEERGAAPLA